MAMATSEPLQRFLDAQQACGTLVASVTAAQWSGPTPCTEWDVRALVNHLVNEQLWATPMLDGQTIEQVGDRLDGDLLGEDPVAAWHQAAKESAAAFSAPSALDGTINSSMGPSPASQYLTEMTCDLIVHRWDLGRALGLEQRFTSDELDQLATMGEGLAGMQDQLVEMGIFGAPRPVSHDADRQSRLLAAIGRDG
jgi:uncharacterized protein (TIGR03086 family)